MRIAINAVAVQGGGGQVYLENVLESLCTAGPSHEFLVFLASHQQALASSLSRSARIVICRMVPKTPWLRALWEQAVLPFLLHRWRVDVYFAAYNTAALLSPVPIVLMAHNINAYSSLDIPWSLYGRIHHAAYRLLGWLSARAASMVVFVSESSARIMAPRMGVPASRMRVVHHGWRRIEHVGSAPGMTLPERYILAVGDLQPHKGYATLLKAFERFVSGNAYPGHLVIVGEQRGKYSDHARRLSSIRERLACRERVHFVGPVMSSALASIYQRADLFVFPSLEETFGLTLVEAMGAGVPLVVADWSLFPGRMEDHPNVGPEICGDAAAFFDPLDPSSLAGAMQRLLADPLLREELVRKGQARVKQFSWNATAAALLDIFRHVESNSSRRPGKAGYEERAC